MSTSSPYRDGTADTGRTDREKLTMMTQVQDRTEALSAERLAQAWPALLTTAMSIDRDNGADYAADVALRLLDAEDVTDARINAARRVLATDGPHGLAWKSVRYVVKDAARTDRERIARTVSIDADNRQHVVPASWADDWHRGRPDPEARQAALDADGRVLRSDPETNYSRERIVRNDAYSAAMGADPSERSKVAAAVARTSGKATPYMAERATPDRIVLVREASLSRLLDHAMRLRAHNVDTEDHAEDRRLRAAWWATFSTRPAPVLRGARAQELARRCDATGKGFGTLLAEHYDTTTPREQSGRIGTREYGRIDWSSLLDAIGAARDATNRRELARMARYAAAYCTQLVREGRYGAPAPNVGAGWRYAMLGGMVPTSVDVPSPEVAAAR